MDEAVPRTASVVVHHAGMPGVLVMAQRAERLVHAGHPHSEPFEHGAHRYVLTYPPYRACRNPCHASERIPLPKTKKVTYYNKPILAYPDDFWHAQDAKKFVNVRTLLEPYMPEDTERKLAWLLFPFFRGAAIGVPHNDVVL